MDQRFQPCAEIGASAPAVSSEEVEKYFRDHRDDYQDVFVSRINVAGPSKATVESSGTAAVRAEMVRARILSGANLETLRDIGPESYGQLTTLELDQRYFGDLPKPDLATEHGLHMPSVITTAPSQPASYEHRH